MHSIFSIIYVRIGKEGVNNRMKMMRKIILLLVALVLVISTQENMAEASDDVTGHWHEAALREMIEKEIMKGYGNGIYLPNGPVTRGQFAIILSRALNLPLSEEGIGFSDVTEETGVMEGVLSAAGAGIITGYKDGTFKPTQKISRQHIAVMVKRALDYLFIEDIESEFTFKDKDLIIYDYYNAISNSVNYEIFKGTIREDGVYFRPLDNATRGEAAAITSRLLKVVEQHSPSVPEPTPELTFDVATISASNEINVVKRFATYEEAARNTTSNQVIAYGNSVLKMSKGLVVTVPTLQSSITILYATPEFKGNGFTYVPADTELEYVNSTESYVEVKIAGIPGYVKHENTQLKPQQTLTGQSYYGVKNGILSHWIYSNTKGNYATYSIGKAPSFLVEGQKYVSWDGIHFETMTGTKIGSSYSYFQFLPARTTTKYTAEELDAYIFAMLKRLETSYPNDKTFNQASTKSKLLGIGTYLKKLEAEKKINALFILALAQHESSYGLSVYALEHNNLFGSNVTDDDPKDFSFDNVEQNMDAFVDNFMNKNYLPPNGMYANGAVFGNKAIGANVKYASDPYWGAKAAGHWYRIDQEMGGKELASPYTIGLTNIAGLNVRTTPLVSDETRAFRYLKGNLPVIVTGELAKTNGYDWYTVKSDDVLFEELYIAKEYIDILPISK